MNIIMESVIGEMEKNQLLLKRFGNVLKGGIIDTYKAIQNKDFMFFFKEQEFKYKNRKLNYDEIINEFLECYNLVKLIGVENIDDTDDTFLSNNYFTSVDNDNSSDSDN